MDAIISNLTEILRHEEEDHDHEDEGDHEESSAVIWAKVVAMISLFILSMIFGFLPMKLNRCLNSSKKKSVHNATNKINTCSRNHHEDSLSPSKSDPKHHQENTHEQEVDTPQKKSKIVKMLLNFGGGVLLSTTFLHLLPEINENIENLQENGVLPQFKFHLAELLMCCGFFLMFFIEEAVHLYIHKKEEQKHHHHNHLKNNTVRKSKSNDEEKEKIDEIFQRNLSFRKRNFEKNFGSPKFSSGRNNSISQTNLIASRSEENMCDNVYPEICVITPQIEDKSNITVSNAVHLPPPVQPTTAYGKKEENLVKNLRGLLIVLALSVHELFEGLAVGLESEPSNVYYMFGAISAHKLVIAFCIGIELVTSNLKTNLIIIYIMTFAIVSPLGIGLGLLLSSNEANGIPTVILQGLACGTLLYVVFFEILLPSVQEKNNHSHIGEHSHDHEYAMPPTSDHAPPSYVLEYKGGRRSTRGSINSVGFVEGSSGHPTFKNGGAHQSYKIINLDSRRNTEGSLNFEGCSHPEIEGKLDDGKSGNHLELHTKCPMSDKNENYQKAEGKVEYLTTDIDGKRIELHQDVHNVPKKRKSRLMNEFFGLLQCLAVLIGFLVMFGLQFLTGHEHSHGHSHGGDEHSLDLGKTVQHPHSH